MEFLGEVVANNNIPFRSIGSGNTVTYQIQYAAATALTNAAEVGVAAFDSSDFSVDANGFVTLNSSAAGQTITGNSGGALSPTGGNWNIITSNSSVIFSGSGSTLTQNFGITNLLLGASGASITSATRNVGVGDNSLQSLSSGVSNSSIGFNSSNLISDGSFNNAFGSLALSNNVSGSRNAAFGYRSLEDCIGSDNSGFGEATLLLLTTGTFNTAIGGRSLVTMVSGNNNTAVGYESLSNSLGSDNISLGYVSGNAYVGSESSNIVIGNTGTIGESNKIRIGDQGTGARQQDESYIAGQLNGLSGRSYKITAPGAYPYTALKTDYVIIVDTSSSRTINLIATKVNNPVYIIKDNVGSAAANNITVSGNGSNIDGSASFTMNVAYQSIKVVWNGTQWNVI